MDYDILAAARKQMNHCKNKGLKQLAPKDGICPRCNRNIYEKVIWHQTSIMKAESVEVFTGIKIADAGKGQIKVCPHCLRDFNFKTDIKDREVDTCGLAIRRKK